MKRHLALKRKGRIGRSWGEPEKKGRKKRTLIRSLCAKKSTAGGGRGSRVLFDSNQILNSKKKKKRKAPALHAKGKKTNCNKKGNPQGRLREDVW